VPQLPATELAFLYQSLIFVALQRNQGFTQEKEKVMGLFNEIGKFFGGSPAPKMDLYTKGQKSFMDNLLGVMGRDMGDLDIRQNPAYQTGLSKLMQLLSDDPQAMQAFQAPALQQFNEQIAPGIAERYTAAGARNSSAMNNALAQAASSLSTNLNAQRAGLQSNALSQLLGYANQPIQNFGSLSNLGLGQQFQYGQPSPGFLQGILPGVGQGIGGGLGSLLGGLLL
jgi:hypothetical protein